MVLSNNIKLRQYLALHCLILHVEYSNFFLILEQVAETYSEPCQTYKMELFAKIVNV